ncbi:MAG: hypothetical protein O7A03_10240, partial [Alphaproteobacteria bacterium]|nr:hypothetical protein [Alphaproteobacteria bacterium]
MTKRTIRIAGIGLAGLMGLMAIAVGAFFVVLMRGPIHVGFLNSYAENVVQGAFGQTGDGIRVVIEDSILVWDDNENGVDFRAVNASLIGAAGETLFEFPRISLRLSAWALLRGRLAPAGLEMSGARVRLYRGGNGGFALGLGSVREVAVDDRDLPLGDIIRNIVSETGTASRYLRSLAITESSFEYQDPEGGRIFTANDVTVVFDRGRDGLTATASLNLVTGQLASRIEISGIIDPGGDNLELAFDFTDLPPALLGQIEPRLSLFDRLHLPVSGSILTVIGSGARVESITFDLQGGAGWIGAAELGLKPLPVSFVGLKGRVDDDFRLFTLENMHLEIDDAVTELSGIVYVDQGVASAQIDMTAKALPIEEIVKLVPMGEEKSITRWIKEHLFSGTIDDLEARMSATMPVGVDNVEGGQERGGLSLESLTGRFDFSDVHGKYLKAMTPISGVSGFGVMDNRSIKVEITHGRYDETMVIVERGLVTIDDFTVPEMKARLEAT